MRCFMVVVLLSVFAVALPAQNQSPIQLSNPMVQGTVLIGAAAVINASDPDFSWGGGLRWSINLNPLARLYVGGEYADRGQFFNLKTLDFSSAVTFGNALYIGLGLYMGTILNMDKARGWKTGGGTDFGWVADIGYNFPDIPGLTASFDLHFGLTDLQPKQTNTLGMVNQLNIRWGFNLGYAIWRG